MNSIQKQWIKLLIASLAVVNFSVIAQGAAQSGTATPPAQVATKPTPEAAKPAQAAAAAAQKVEKAPVEQEVSAITVFGRLPPKQVTQRVRRIDSAAASNCNFSTSRSDAELEEEWLDAFYAKDKTKPQVSNGISTEATAGQGGTDGTGLLSNNESKDSFSDNAPDGTAEAGVNLSEGCSKSDVYAAAGRNRILRNDKTLSEGFAAYDEGNFEVALERFKKAYSKIGYEEAALTLGDMYLYGQGTSVDVKEAINWYTKAAEAKFVKTQIIPFEPAHPEKASSRTQAQIKLARIHAAGLAGTKDPKLARKWYEAASDLEYVPAQYILGQMHQSGYGGDKDIKKAVKLYTNAGESGHAGAQFALAEYYYTAEDTEANRKSSFEWYQQAAFNPYPNAKKPHAQLALAEMYDQGIGVKADPQKAFAFYKLSAVAGHPDAQNALAIYFYSGELVGKDHAITRRLFDAAASQGQSDAMFNLALMMQKGEGGEVDPVKSYVWLSLAAKLGHSKAPAALTRLEAKLTPAQKTQANEFLKPKAAK